MQHFTVLLAAIISNILIMSPFARALFNPDSGTDFIFQTAFFILFVEFLSIHSSGMLTSSDSSKFKMKDKVLLLIIYGLFAAALAFIAQSPYPILIFMGSLVAKILFIKASPKRDAHIGLSAVLLIITVLVCVIFAPVLSSLFPFSQEVMAAKPDSSSGIFVDTPQAILVWGLLYYGLDTLFEVILAFKPNFVKVQIKK